jgi:hypothetical protein
VILILPVEIPVLNPQQRQRRSIGQRRDGLHLFPEIVRVRHDAVGLHVDLHPQPPGDGVVLLARRNVDLGEGAEQARHAHVHQPLLGRAIGEVQRDPRALAFDLAGRMEVELQDEVRARR